MNSAPRMSRKKKWLLCGGGFASVAAIGIGIYVARSQNKNVSYRELIVKRGKISQMILSTGTVAPENRLDLKAPVAGRIEKVLVREGERVKKGQVLAWMSSTERAALIDTASSKGAVEMAYWDSSYKMTPILAPGRGLVILKSCDTGQTVTVSDTILSLSDRLIVKANVDETDLSLVKQGQPATLLLDAFPTSPLEAKVYHIGYDAKTVSNVTTYEVDVIADHTPDFMKSGMTANITFHIAETEDTLVIPVAAIRREKGHSYVLVPNSDPSGEPVSQEIKVGISDGRKTEVLSGIEEGQTVLAASLRSLAKHEDATTSPFGGGPPNMGRRH